MPTDTTGQARTDCTKHEEEIRKLRERSHAHANLIAAKDAEIAELTGSLTNLSERIPVDLASKLLTIDMELKNLSGLVTRNYVSREEFLTVKMEHEQIKKLVFGFIGLAMVAIVSGMLGLILRKP